MNHNNTKQYGFTVVELAIATMIFSVVLLLITFGMIQIGRAFTKSVNEARAQEAARTIADDVASTIKFNGEDIKPLTPIMGAGGAQVEGFCAGRKRYSYILDRQMGSDTGQLPHAFVAEYMEESCTKQTQPRDISVNFPASDKAVELLYPNMQIDKFSIQQASQNNFYEINVRILFGQDMDFRDDPFDPSPDPDRVCEPNVGSTQFCAFSELSTTVQKRVQ